MYRGSGGKDEVYTFLQGLLDHVTVLIGIAVGKEAVAGVIHQPYWNYQVREHYHQQIGCYHRIKRSS